MKAIRGFEDLAVFQKAYKYSLELHTLSVAFPSHEQFELGSQLRRASKSICGNIAEGFGKQSFSSVEFRRYLAMAMGSADEMRVWLRYCYDLDYLTKAQWEYYQQGYQDIAKMLMGLHRSWS